MIRNCLINNQHKCLAHLGDPYHVAVDVAAEISGGSIDDFLDGPGADFALSRELRRRGMPPDVRDAAIERLFSED